MSQASFNDDNDDDDEEEEEEEEDDPRNLSISTSSAGRRRIGSGQRAMGHTDIAVGVVVVVVVVGVVGGCSTVKINVGSVKASSNDRTAKLVPDQSGE